MKLVTKNSKHIKPQYRNKEFDVISEDDETYLVKGRGDSTLSVWKSEVKEVYV